MSGASGMVRVGVAGCGVFGLEYLNALARRESAEIAAVCDPNAESVNRVAELFHVPRVCRELPELLAWKHVDAVILATPSSLHAEMAEQCLAAGKHVLVEKPVALTVEQVESLAAAAQARPHVVVLPGHILRHSSTHRRIHRAVRDGAVGLVQSFVASRDRELGHHDRYSGTSPTFLTMIHDIDLAVWMTGQRPTSVSALAARGDARTQPSVVAAILETYEGSIWSLRCSWALPRGRDNEDRLDIIGTAGTISWTNTPDFVLRQGVDTSVSTPSADRLFSAEIEEEVEHFIDCILAGKQSDRVSIDDAVLGVRVAEAVNESLRRNGETQRVR